MILQGVKLTIQPLGVGYANSHKMAKMGGYVAFSPIYACYVGGFGDLGDPVVPTLRGASGDVVTVYAY